MRRENQLAFLAVLILSMIGVSFSLSGNAASCELDDYTDAVKKADSDNNTELSDKEQTDAIEDWIKGDYTDTEINDEITSYWVKGCNASKLIGDTDEEEEETVFTNKDPKAEIVVRSTFAKVHDSLFFDGSHSTDPDGTIEDYEWVIDNERFEGDSLTHRFTEPGRYDVSLKVTDNKGAQDTDTVRITVQDDLTTTLPPEEGEEEEVGPPPPNTANCSKPYTPAVKAADTNNDGLLSDDEQATAVQHWVKGTGDYSYTGTEISQELTPYWVTCGPKTTTTNKPSNDVTTVLNTTTPPTKSGIIWEPNGNGYDDSNDCVLIAQTWDDPIMQKNAQFFDYNQDGELTHADAVTCTDKWGGVEPGDAVARPQGAGPPSDSKHQPPGDGSGPPDFDIPFFGTQNSYIVERFDEMFSQQKGVTQTIAISTDGEFDIDAVIKGDLCLGGASVIAEHERQGRTIKTYNLKDSIFFWDQTKFESFPVKRGDTVKIVANGQNSLGICNASSKVRSKLKYPEDPSKPATYIAGDGGVEQAGFLLVEVNESPDADLERCTIDWGNGRSTTVIPREATQFIDADATPGEYLATYTCQTKDGQFYSSETVLKLDPHIYEEDLDGYGKEPDDMPGPGEGHGGPPHEEEEYIIGTGEPCHATAQCKSKLYCNPTKYDEGQKACCPIGERWNGGSCEIVIPTRLLKFSVPQRAHKDDLITVSVSPNGSEVTLEQAEVLLEDVYGRGTVEQLKTDKTSNNSLPVRLGGENFSFDFSPRSIGFDSKLILVSFEAHFIYEGRLNFYESDQFVIEVIDAYTAEGSPCIDDGSCRADLECNPVADGFNDFESACCNAGTVWNGRECRPEEQAMSDYFVELNATRVLSQPRTVQLDVKQGPEDAWRCLIDWGVGTDDEDFDIVTGRAGEHRFFHQYEPSEWSGRKMIYYRCIESTSEIIGTAMELIFLDEVPTDPKPPSGDTFDIVFIPLNYTDQNFSRFELTAEASYTRFLLDSPFELMKNPERKVKYHIVPNDPSLRCKIITGDCLQLVKERARSSDFKYLGNADLVAGICTSCTDPDAGGVAEAVESHISVSRADTGTVLHEFGHNLGLSHLRALDCESSPPRNACRAPNGSDCNSEFAGSFHMSYCSPTSGYGPAGYSHLQSKLRGFMCEAEPSVCDGFEP